MAMVLTSKFTAAASVVVLSNIRDVILGRRTRPMELSTRHRPLVLNVERLRYYFVGGLVLDDPFRH
jgi:hypothetical protein